MVLSTEHVWSKKLNTTDISCDSIINHPWKLPTIEEIINITNNPAVCTIDVIRRRQRRHGNYEDTCLDIVATGTKPRPRAMISRYSKVGITSAYTMNSARAERLYNIASYMLDIITSEGII